MSEDQCAVVSDGQLLDEKEISWFNDADDADPISTSTGASLSTATSHISAERPDGLRIECQILGVCVVQRAVRVSQQSSGIGTERNPWNGRDGGLNAWVVNWDALREP